MADLTIAAAAASISAAGGSAAGLPPHGVIACAIGGAIIGVWVSKPNDVPISWKWAVAAIGLILGYAAAAVIAATVWDAVTPAITSPTWSVLMRIPSWVVSGGVALGGFWLLPVVASWVKRRADQ